MLLEILHKTFTKLDERNFAPLKDIKPKCICLHFTTTLSYEIQSYCQSSDRCRSDKEKKIYIGKSKLSMMVTLTETYRVAETLILFTIPEHGRLNDTESCKARNWIGSGYRIEDIFAIYLCSKIVTTKYLSSGVEILKLW